MLTNGGITLRRASNSAPSAPNTARKITFSVIRFVDASTWKLPALRARWRPP